MHHGIGVSKNLPVHTCGCGHCGTDIHTFIHAGCFGFIIRLSRNSEYSPPLVLSDLLLLGAGLSHCVPAQLAEHLKEVKRK